ncbi:MAG: hypothetical protein ACI85I_001393 [Arenicella sp.]|jgi:hypothetical protein
MTTKTIQRGFILSGFANIFAILIFSRCFTNEYIPQFDNIVMSNFGLLMIVVWGFAYLAVAKDFEKVKWLVAVFAVEKLIYGIAWVNWQLKNELSTVFEQDTFAGIFYSIYGINDWLFCLFFSYVFVRLVRE